MESGNIAWYREINFPESYLGAKLNRHKMDTKYQDIYNSFGSRPSWHGIPKVMMKPQPPHPTGRWGVEVVGIGNKDRSNLMYSLYIMRSIVVLVISPRVGHFAKSLRDYSDITTLESTTKILLNYYPQRPSKEFNLQPSILSRRKNRFKAIIL